MRTAAVIVAAGKGLRMGGTVPKQYLPVCGKPVLAHTLLAFEKSGTDDVIVVCPQGDEEYVRAEIVEKYGIRKVSAVVPGGKERFDSSYRGILAATEAGESEENPVTHILIHDGVRALITAEGIDRIVEALKEYPAVIPAVRVKDTVRRISADGFSEGVVDRAALMNVQTPQGFERELLIEAYHRFYEDAAADADVLGSVTDDAMLIEKYTDVRAKVIEGSYANMKITTPEDLAAAEAFLQKKML